MELANNAIEVAREGIEFRNILVDGIEPNTKCRQAYAQLRDCVLTNKLNIFDKDAVRSTCQLNEWHNECPGAIRRNHIQILYRKSLSQRLYTQDQLNKYMEAKNNHKHWGIIDHRY